MVTFLLKDFGILSNLSNFVTAAVHAMKKELKENLPEYLLDLYIKNWNKNFSYGQVQRSGT